MRTRGRNNGSDHPSLIMLLNINANASLGDLVQPATVLIERISEVIGGALLPLHMERVAKAQAKVELINAKTKIKITEMEQRALQRSLYEEVRKQKNIESIVSQALPQLDAGAKPEAIEGDWIVNFFDKCRLVSDQAMQDIWAKILAGETNSPGRFSKRTVNFMTSLDGRDAQLFTKLCAFNWRFVNALPPIDTWSLVYDAYAAIYEKNGIDFGALKHLDSIGLISFDNALGYKVMGLTQVIRIAHQDFTVTLKLPKEKDNDFSVGKVSFTLVGRELATLCDSANTIPDLKEYVFDQWRKKGIVIE